MGPLVNSLKACKEYPKGKEKFKGRGWCPPRQYEYDNFKADCDHEVQQQYGGTNPEKNQTREQ
eukprot:2575357-Amphidinium_carterae.1